MSGKELVSVVIPAYNAVKFIEDAIKSCFTQTYRPVEIVVVNDGSTDSTVHVVNDLSDLIPDKELELRIIDIGENKGAANALNVGFSSARGDYVCWLSSDDAFIDKRKVQKQVDFMKKTNALWSYFRDYYTGITISSAVISRGSYLQYLRILDSVFIHDSDLRLMLLLFRNPINGSSTMIKRNCIEAYGQFDPITRNVDGDGDLWMRYSALRLKLQVLKGASVFYRVHPKQTSKRKNLMMHGSELTRMRILLTLERKGNLVKLIKKFTPYLAIILMTKEHLNRPFVSEFLFNYILAHRREFNCVFLKYIHRSLSDVKKHENYLMLNRNEFLKDLKLFVGSHTYKNFEDLLKMMIYNGENNSNRR